LQPAPVEEAIALQNGDYLLAFTDGIFEARNEGDEQLGLVGLQAIFAAACALDGSAEAVLDRVIAKAAEFRGAVKAEDDITVFVVRLA
jgi:serine phosphatase RsbU (regulator of sigma subunit)